MKRTLVIGNGFDLDVGLKTRYIDFAESKWWPFKDARLQDGCETLAYTLCHFEDRGNPSYINS